MLPRLRRSVTGAVVALAVLAGACSDVSGPGTLQVQISGAEALGGVALEITGVGLRDVSAAREAWVAAHPFRDGDADGMRVVVILEEPGPVVLSLAVRDVAAVLPEVRVLEASDGRDRAIYELDELQVGVAR